VARPSRSTTRGGSPRETPSCLRVAAGLISRRGRLLVLQRHREEKLFPLRWEFPGGKLQRGETPRQALRRELREELGIRARVGERIAHTFYRYRNGLEVELWFFTVPAYRGRLRCRHGEQTRWIRVQDLPSYHWLDADRVLVAQLVARRAAPESREKVAPRARNRGRSGLRAAALMV
jgi:8-oxo-dGTP diphosphatase